MFGALPNLLKLLFTVGHKLKYGPFPSEDPAYPHYGIASIIAVNMIMAGASGGITAVVIAAWAQVSYDK